MLNNIAIGSSATLDMQTRTLTRRQDGESVTLPASACLCLEALIRARGEVLSQEQLMDIGWRSAGVEVTENSVRVMINKLRRALNTLDLQDSVTLLAVTRSGYRLIVRESESNDTPLSTAAPVPAATQPEQVSVPKPTEPPTSREPEAPVIVAPVQERRRKWAPRVIAAIAGAIAGLAVAMTVHTLYIVQPEDVEFVPWHGPGIPAGAEVRVQKENQNQQAMIEATLETYKKHVLDKRPTEKPAKVLYVTIGSSRINKHLGLIACQQPFQGSNNDCESFYFRFY
ncbi:winged helix-turn-helix domain-containing protein [Enterobacter sp. CC120223-11]|uniref:winged helix-turn-helix domain-containing protein n=1 Tax=Enterobacter sp. CC120223-11 TaxID=1378073 RepID=UPI000BD65900|nr:winged helix-turn-helix domain-containing protein [Enterobacter sp. CC120223-11]SNY67792.1 DNA-binding winged helix-turn-helix (wHTH) domain-containing protein [Enterobacter sp. CC120223-11]